MMRFPWRRIRPLKPGQGVAEYALSFEWDSFGRALKLVYPDSEVVTNTYDSGGLLKTVTGYRPWSDESEKYVRRARYDVFGQRVSLELGNGAVTAYAYEPDTRRLAALSTRVGQSQPAQLQALGYGYDLVGNIRSLSNRLTQPVGQKYGGAVAYSFTYDALYRLQAAEGAAQVKAEAVDRFAAAYEYSDIHNLTRSVLTRSVVSTTGQERPPGEQRDETYVYDAAHSPVELACLLEEMIGALTQGAIVTYFYRAFPEIPLRVLLECGSWSRVSGGGLDDAGFNALLAPWLSPKTLAPESDA